MSSEDTEHLPYWTLWTLHRSISHSPAAPVPRQRLHCENLSGETFWLKGSPYKMQKLCPRHKSRTPVFAIWSTGCRRHAGARQFLNSRPNNCFMTSQQFYFWSPPPRTVSQQYLVEIFCIRNIIFMLQRTGEKLEPCETLQFFVYEVNRCKIKSCC